MINGLESFKKAFSDFNDYFVIIGGTACHILFDSLGLEFRTTKDIDMVLFIEQLNDSFGQTLMQYIKDGQYQTKQLEDGKRQLYRFIKPKTDGYPAQLELFVREPYDWDSEEFGHIAPIPKEEMGYSLSAILLDDEYYQIIEEGRIIVDGLPILGAVELILLKAKACSEIRERNEGTKHIKKHTRDIVNLATVMDRSDTHILTDGPNRHMNEFVFSEEFNKVDMRNVQAASIDQIKEILVQKFRLNDGR